MCIIKEIVIGVGEIIWAIVELVITAVTVYPVIAVMWILVQLGLWEMSKYPYRGHFRLPWS